MIRVCPNCQQKNRVQPQHLARTTRCGKCKTLLGPLAEPIEADAALFDSIAQHAVVPVLVDFWAAWCGPCHMAAPEVARVAREMAGQALVVKVDTDRHPEVAQQFGVQGIPNFVILKGGKAVFQKAGVVPGTEMKRWLETVKAA